MSAGAIHVSLAARRLIRVEERVEIFTVAGRSGRREGERDSEKGESG